ncbi:hypothetical protein QYE76_037905 [Lolium multiflorum]|uniref:Uncharacterized protein n=1 Tax=Lolium multiflorum TaxID=4521 RepID=A0AAD8WQE1_LOLMU|nr:hypothetical protein QYE76_037905 [Lolium multiflorum]
MGRPTCDDAALATRQFLVRAAGARRQSGGSGGGELLVHDQIIDSNCAVSLGLNLGKEGPFVHISACLANLLSQGSAGRFRLRWKWLRYFNNDRDSRDLITCGALSGVCAAFRSPVGGVLFALKEAATWWRSARAAVACAISSARPLSWWCCRASSRYTATGSAHCLARAGSSSSRSVTSPSTTVTLVGVLGALYNYLLHKVLRLYYLINGKGQVAKLALALTVCVFTSVGLYVIPFAFLTNGMSGNFKQFNCPAGHYNVLVDL